MKGEVCQMSATRKSFIKHDQPAMKTHWDVDERDSYIRRLLQRAVTRIETELVLRLAEGLRVQQ
jgi:hypothetical protein